MRNIGIANVLKRWTHFNFYRISIAVTYVSCLFRVLKQTNNIPIWPKAANILSFLAASSQLWIGGGVRGVILAAIAATNTAPRTLLGCAWTCATFALEQTWIGSSRLGSLNMCIRFHCSLRCPSFDWSMVGRGWKLCGPAIGSKNQLLSSFQSCISISSSIRSLNL